MRKRHAAASRVRRKVYGVAAQHFYNIDHGSPIALGSLIDIPIPNYNRKLTVANFLIAELLGNALPKVTDSMQDSIQGLYTVGHIHWLPIGYPNHTSCSSRSSRAVSRPRAVLTRYCLTSVSKKELVYPAWQGHWLNTARLKSYCRYNFMSLAVTTY